MLTLRDKLLVTTAGMALAATLSSHAMADPLPFNINPNAIPGISGYSPPVTATDINGTSDALITQTGASTQTETGWVQVASFTNNGSGIGHNVSGLEIPSGDPNTYDIYISFSAAVSGITGFGANQIGTVTAFSFTMFADPQQNDVASPATIAGGVTTLPTITNTNDDVVLAVGNLVAGTAGFQPVTGAPTFNATSTFDVCNGTAGEAMEGSTEVAASACGTSSGLSYFTSPTPFYSFDLASNTSGSALNIGHGDGSVGNEVTLNGIVTDINFAVPEPASLALLGSGLLGFGVFGRRRRNRKAQGAA